MKKGTLALIIVGALFAVILLVVLIGAWFVIGKGNQMIRLDEGLKAAWGQVENQYQRRYDLIPNLVEIVKGYAKHEKETLMGVTQARAKMGGMLNLPPEALKNPAMMEKYRQAQQSLGGALSRLMMLQERYPDLKANQNFRDLQAQLEGTENRIAVERRRYNESVKTYNTYIRVFPNSIVAGMKGFTPAELFKMDAGAKEAPKIKF